MSYLEGCKNLPDMKKGIISFWVKTGKIEPKADPWNPDWIPKGITEYINNQRIAFTGSSYVEAFPQFVQPHIFVYPPGPYNDISFQPEPRVTFKDNFVPFITFGDPGQKYTRCEWKMRQIIDKYFYVGPGIGTKSLVSEFPEPAGEEENIVPPSMIGVVSTYSGPRLRVILQTKNKPQTLKGYAWAQSEVKPVVVLVPMGGPGTSLAHMEVIQWRDTYKDGYLVTAGIPNPMGRGYAFINEDVSLLECAQHPEAFIMDVDVKVNDDKWHHVLISFDLEGICKAKALGTDPTDPPCWPGPYGQFSGTRGEYALGFDGAPFEDCGKFGPAEDGEISSTCKAWVAIDDKNYDGKNLNHEAAWKKLEGAIGHVKGDAFYGAPNGKTGKALLEGLDKQAILPPSAFLAPFKEIRTQMTTSLTLWERFYRTELGGFTGPACKIEDTGEKRRYDHDRPEYEFTPEALPTAGFPVCIPAGEKMVDYNQNIILAELQIWADQSLDVSDESNRRLFIKENDKGELVPASMRKAAEKLGKPHVKLHGTSNWKKGYNTGTLGVRIIGEGTPDERKEKIEEGQFTPTGQIDRYKPDPKLEAKKEEGAS